jgi:transcriptional regulator with XRE-family HTH domain
MVRVENAFRKWMDEQKVSASQVASVLGVMPQTIHNWRSGGVPARRLPHVHRLMERWHEHAGPLRSSLLVRTLPDRFEEWNRAAMAKGLTVSEWAEACLDEAAVGTRSTGSSARIEQVAEAMQ